MRRGWELRTRGAQGKATAKARMGRVNDLNLRQGVLGTLAWVVERGIKVCARAWVVERGIKSLSQ